jgi:hypothetical protein
MNITGICKLDLRKMLLLPAPLAVFKLFVPKLQSHAPTRKKIVTVEIGPGDWARSAPSPSWQKYSRAGYMI